MVTKNVLENDMAHSRELYAEYLKGKRVAIVGPAPSILNTKQKEKLEGFDVIVRLNKAVPVPTDLIGDVGGRTDVLYNCMNPSQECGGFIDIDVLHKNGVKFLVSPYAEYKEYRFGNDVLDFATRNLKSNAPISFCHIDKTLFARLMEIMKLPNTGVNAIIDVLHHDIKELYITGLTFFRGGYIKQYRGYSEKQVLDRMAKYKLHDQDKQLVYMKKLLRNNPRVIMDQALTDIIYEDDKVPIQIDSSLIQKRETNLVITTNVIDETQLNEIKSQVNIPETATILAVSKPVVPKVVAKVQKPVQEPKKRVDTTQVSIPIPVPIPVTKAPKTAEKKVLKPTVAKKPVTTDNKTTVSKANNMDKSKVTKGATNKVSNLQSKLSQKDKEMQGKREIKSKK